MFENIPVGKKTEQSEIEPHGLVEKEKSLLQRFREKAKSISAVLALITSLTLAQGAFEQAYAADKRENPKKVEDVENIKKPDPVAFLDKLFNIPDQKVDQKLAAPGQNRLMQEEVARILIAKYALEIKGLSSGQVSREDEEVAVNELQKNLDKYIDETYGNKDGKVSPEEIRKFEDTVQHVPGHGESVFLAGNPGLTALEELGFKIPDLSATPAPAEQKPVGEWKRVEDAEGHIYMERDLGNHQIERQLVPNDREPPQANIIESNSDVAFLGELLNSPNKETAMEMIQKYAISKNWSTGKVVKGPGELPAVGIAEQDVATMAKELLSNSSAYIEQKYGGGVEGMNKFREATRNNPGLAALYEMADFGTK